MKANGVVFWLTGWMFTLGVAIEIAKNLDKVLNTWDWLSLGISLLISWPVLLGICMVRWWGG